MRVGDLVKYRASTHHTHHNDWLGIIVREIPGNDGIVADIDRADPVDPEETIYRIFWVDNGVNAWYYSNEVERVDATRRPD